MEKIKVSVVMPFHNGKEFIDETMQCLINQSLKEIEIICVDDASTDGTLDILREYEKKDNRILVLEQKKANAGVARNLGMTYANGTYLLFLDSDDLFEADLLEQMYVQCEEMQADLCVCNADQFDNQSKKYIEKPQYLREKLIPKELPFSMKSMGKYILYFTTSVPWNKMVRKSLLEEKDIQFQDIERANDQYFSIMLLLLANRITIVNKKLVHYRVKQKDNLTTRFSETPFCAYEAMLAVKFKLESMRLLENPEIRCAFDNKVINLMQYSLNIQSSIVAYRELYQLLQKEGFHKLGLEIKEEEYYFNKNEYKNFKLIYTDSYDVYLLKKNREYRDHMNDKKVVIQKLKKENIEIKKVLDRKNQELKKIKDSKRYKAINKIMSIYDKMFRK